MREDGEAAGLYSRDVDPPTGIKFQSAGFGVRSGLGAKRDGGVSAVRFWPERCRGQRLPDHYVESLVMESLLMMQDQSKGTCARRT